MSKGLDVLLNDSLRNVVSLLYERSYSYYRKYEDERIAFHNDHSEAKLMEYFTMIYNPKLYTRIEFQISQEDYLKMQNDDSFIKLLYAISFENSAVQERAKRTENSILSLLQLLEKELESLKNN